MKSFTHEQKTKLSQEEYVAITGLMDRKTRPWRIVLALMLGLAGLFWAYTFILGILLLATVALVLFAPRLLPGTAAEKYRNTAYLRHEITYHVSGQNLAVTGPELHCQFGWENLRVWREREDWLILSPMALPYLYLSVRLLKDAGVYDDVLALARQHGVEFGAPKSKIVKEQIA